MSAAQNTGLPANGVVIRRPRSIVELRDTTRANILRQTLPRFVVLDRPMRQLPRRPGARGR